MNTNIDRLCQLLKIDRPHIIETRRLPRNCRGQYIPATDTIEVRDLNDWFAILHELRHKWQIFHAPHLVNSYIPLERVRWYGLFYNDQEAEQDADAFAIYITKAHLLSRLSYEDVVKTCRFISADEVHPIAERLKYIAEEEFPTHTEAVLTHYHS